MRWMVRATALGLGIIVTAALATAAQTGAKPERESKAGAETAAAKPGNAIKDSWITLRVHSQFVPEAALDGSDIDVDTNAGVVTLSGSVATEAGRARALALAKGIDGVKSVVDKLRVVPNRNASADARDAGAASREAGGAAAGTAREAERTTADKTQDAGRAAGKGATQGERTAGRPVADGWIKSKIAAQFVTEKSLDNSDIDVDVSKGTVVLSGTVRTAAARERATALAKGTDGVRSVKNNLRVESEGK